MNNRATQLQALIADDDAGSLLILESMFESLSIETVRATSVAGAKKLLIDVMPHVAILDVLLPDGDGIDILLEIRKAELPTAVALITSSLQEFPFHKCGAVRPDIIFSKPLDHTKVCKWIEEAVSSSDQRKAS